MSTPDRAGLFAAIGQVRRRHDENAPLHMVNTAEFVDAVVEVLQRAEYHDGVVFGIRHPGPSQLGCPYCIETLKLPVPAGAGQ